MMRTWLPFFFIAVAGSIHAKTEHRVVDIPTRPGVTQRMLVLSVEDPKATVILFAGGHGGLRISDSGSFTWGSGNFLVGSRQLLTEHGFNVIVIRWLPAVLVSRDSCIDEQLGNAPRKQLLSFTGGEDRGDPCEAGGYHGFNGIERDVVAQMARWILAR